MSQHSSRTRTFRRNRTLVLAQTDVCWLCGKRGATTVDHVRPKSRGGTDDPENLRPACHTCNARRGNGTPKLRVSRQW